MQAFGLKLKFFPVPKGLWSPVSKIVSDLFIIILVLGTMLRAEGIRPIPIGIVNDPPFPCIFHPVIVTFCSWPRLVVSLIRELLELLAALVVEILTFPKKRGN